MVDRLSRVHNHSKRHFNHARLVSRTPHRKPPAVGRMDKTRTSRLEATTAATSAGLVVEGTSMVKDAERSITTIARRTLALVDKLILTASLGPEAAGIPGEVDGSFGCRRRIRRRTRGMGSEGDINIIRLKGKMRRSCQSQQWLRIRKTVIHSRKVRSQTVADDYEAIGIQQTPESKDHASGSAVRHHRGSTARWEHGLYIRLIRWRQQVFEE